MGDKSIKTMKAKTKIWLQRIITCHCNQCVKKKWSRYQKKTSPRLKVAFIGVMIAFLVIDSIGNWYDKTWNEDRWNIINKTNAEVVEAVPGLETNARGEDSTSTKEHNAHPISVKAETKTMGSAAPVAPQVEVIEKIKKAFPGEEELAVAVAKCESSLDPSRIGDTHMKYPSIGLFQINQTWHKYDTKTLQNPDENIRIAKEIKDRWGNWNAWSCYKFDYYKKHLATN